MKPNAKIRIHFSTERDDHVIEYAGLQPSDTDVQPERDLWKLVRPGHPLNDAEFYVDPSASAKHIILSAVDAFNL